MGSSTLRIYVLVVVGLLVTQAVVWSVGEVITTPSGNDETTSPAEDTEKQTKIEELESRLKNGIVTLEFHAENISDTSAVQRGVRTSLAKILSRSSTSEEEASMTTEAGATRRRREAAAAAAYDPDGIRLIDVDPPVKDERLRVPVVAQNTAGDVLPAETLKEKVDANRAEISVDAGAPLGEVYVGLPEDVAAKPGGVAPAAHRRRSVWEQHFWMFMAVLILLAVALLTLILCCLCFRCRSKRKATPPPHSKEPSDAKTPVPVEETVELAPSSAPLQSSAPPPPPMQEGPSTHSAPPPTSDEENGWIIPIDQLSPEELDQPDVQISRL